MPGRGTQHSRRQQQFYPRLRRRLFSAIFPEEYKQKNRFPTVDFLVAEQAAAPKNQNLPLPESVLAQPKFHSHFAKNSRRHSLPIPNYK